MPRLPVSHGVRGAAAQAAAHYARQRRAERFDPAAGLFVTHRFALDDLIADADVFPTATVPLTFAVDLQVTSATPNGIVFEIGGENFGTAFAFDSTNGLVHFVSGGGRNQTDGAGTAWSGFGFPNAEDAGTHRFVGAVNPGLGVVALWHNGRLVGAAKSSGGAFPNFHDSHGGRVNGSEDAVNNRVPGGAAVGLSSVILVGPVRFFYRQLPRAMPRVGLGNDDGDGAWSN
jgi:hypothetical protein